MDMISGTFSLPALPMLYSQFLSDIALAAVTDRAILNSAKGSLVEIGAESRGTGPRCELHPPVRLPSPDDDNDNRRDRSCCARPDGRQYAKQILSAWQYYTRTVVAASVVRGTTHPAAGCW